MSKQQQSGGYFTPPQFATSLGVSADTVLAWIRSGELEALNLAGSRCTRPRYRISQDAIDRFLRLRAVAVQPRQQRRRNGDELEVMKFF